jgi:Protein of unknown function (DUF2442)
MSINKLTEVKSLPDFKLYVRFKDGVEGEVDLNDLAGKGVFSFWNTPGNFEKVYIDKVSGAIAWSDQLDICPDAIYEDLTIKFSDAKN